MLDFLRRLWNYDVQLVPIALAVALVELPAWIQRRAQIAYVPIYFAFFPLAALNSDLSIYLGEDYFLGRDVIDEDAEPLRRRIVAKGILSMAIAALAIPAFAGFVAAFFLTPTTMRDFLIATVLIKLPRILISLRDFPSHGSPAMRHRALLSFIYLAYVGVFVQVALFAYSWPQPFIVAGDWSGLIAALSSVIFLQVLGQALLLGLLTAVFISLITDRKVRAENLATRTENSQSQGPES